MDEFAEKYQDHAQTIIDFNRLCYDKTYNGDRVELEIGVSDLLYDLLTKWSTHNNTLHKWVNAEAIYCGDVIFIHANDDESDVNIQVLINRNGIFLEMNISCPENLPKMRDDFWQQLLELNSYGHFELTDNECFHDTEEKLYPRFFSTNSSSIFRLMRNIIAYPLLYDGEEMGLGNLCVSWPYEQYSIAEVFEKGCGAFERLWYLNQRMTAGE